MRAIGLAIFRSARPKARVPASLSTAPEGQNSGRKCDGGYGPRSRNPRREMERPTGFEPATSSLGSWHSATELRPPGDPDYTSKTESDSRALPGYFPSRSDMS